MRRTNEKDIAFDGLEGAVSLLTHAKNVFAKLCINDIFGRSWALKGASGVTGRLCPTLGGERLGWIKTTRYILILEGQFPSLPMKKMTKPNLLISMAFLVALGLLGAPGVTDGWYATPGECQGSTNQKHLYFDGSYEAVPRFTLEKKGSAKSSYLGGVFGRFRALRGAPGVTSWWCATSGGWQVRKYDKESCIADFWPYVYNEWETRVK